MLRDFDYEKLTYDERKHIHESLAETTLKHISASGGLFSPLEFDPAAHPSQMLETTHLAPSPVAEGEVADLATIARRDLFLRTREELARQSALVKTVRFLMDRKGVNIFPVSNHGTIEDIAIWTAAWSEQLDEDSWQQQNGLVISRGVTTIGAFGMAASEVVEKGGHVFMSFPRTTTIDELDIEKGLIDTNNRTMRREIHTWLGEDLLHKVLRHKLGKTLNIAWSGKTDQVEYGDDHRPTRITMGKIGKGTLDIVKRGLVLPIVMWDGKDGSEPFVEIGGLTEVTSLDGAQSVQNWQRETLAGALGIADEAVQIED